jgi:hypothetical protein
MWVRESLGMASLRVMPLLVTAGVLAAFGASALPRGLESGRLLAIKDDPVAIADHALRRSFDAAVARREIAAALRADDAELARSFIELAAARGVAVDPRLAEKVAAANSPAANVIRTAGHFTRGLITGEPDDAVSLAGTAVGDLFVFGDIRDAVREGARFTRGEHVDKLVLGLACVGLAITAGTYATLGAGVPARVGVSLVKAARKTGRIGASMAGWLGRTLRQAVDMTAVRRVFAGLTAVEPTAAVRAAREVVKVEKSDTLVRLVGDVGKVQAKAGTRAALDGLKIAHGPKDVARLAKLAEKQGGKTRAILKLFGRGAIFLSLATFNAASWLVWTVLTLFGFASTLKTAAERMTLRVTRRRRARRELALAREALARLPARV